MTEYAIHSFIHSSTLREDWLDGSTNRKNAAILFEIDQ